MSFTLARRNAKLCDTHFKPTDVFSSVSLYFVFPIYSKCWGLEMELLFVVIDHRSYPA